MTKLTVPQPSTGERCNRRRRCGRFPNLNGRLLFVVTFCTSARSRNRGECRVGVTSIRGIV
jgi:hypothetical protein